MKFYFITVVLFCLPLRWANCQYQVTVKYSSDIFANTAMTISVLPLKVGDSVKIKSFYPKTNAFFVERQDTSGYVYFENLNMTFDTRMLMDDTRAATNKGKYWIGMFMQDASRNLDPPDKVNTVTGTWGKTEYWVYRKKNLLLRFENEILAAYSED